MATMTGSHEQRETHDLIGSDKVEGTNVYRSSGEKIGEIERIMLEKRSGKVAYAVMSFGGFLGIGHDHYPVPWARLTYNERLGGYEVNVSDQELERASKYGDTNGTGTGSRVARSTITIRCRPTGADALHSPLDTAHALTSTALPKLGED